MMKTVIVVMTVAALSVACDDTRSGSADSSTAGTSPTPSARSVPLEGRWQSGTVTPEQVRKHLAEAGLGEAAPTVVREQAYPQEFTLIMASGRYQLLNADGDIYDEGAYEVQGDEVTFTAAATGAGPTFRWSASGSALDLEFLSSTGTPYKGLPDEAFARPIYDVPEYEAVQ